MAYHRRRISEALTMVQREKMLQCSVALLLTLGSPLQESQALKRSSCCSAGFEVRLRLCCILIFSKANTISHNAPFG